MYTCSCRKAIKNLSFLLIQWTEILLHYMVRLGQNLHLLLTCTYVDMYNLVGENWGLEESAFFYLCMSLFSAPIFFCRFWSQYDLWFQSKNQRPFWFSVLIVEGCWEQLIYLTMKMLSYFICSHYSWFYWNCIVCICKYIDIKINIPKYRPVYNNVTWKYDTFSALSN